MPAQPAITTPGFVLSADGTHQVYAVMTTPQFAQVRGRLSWASHPWKALGTNGVRRDGAPLPIVTIADFDVWMAEQREELDRQHQAYLADVRAKSALYLNTACAA